MARSAGGGGGCSGSAGCSVHNEATHGPSSASLLPEPDATQARRRSAAASAEGQRRFGSFSSSHAMSSSSSFGNPGTCVEGGG